MSHLNTLVNGFDALSGAAFGGGGAVYRGGSYVRNTPNTIKNKATLSAQKSGLPGATNGKQDAYRHCVATGEASRQYGETVAILGGMYHEITNPNPPSVRAMDLNNNAAVAHIGSKSNSFNEVEKGCMTAVSSGRLQTRP